MINLQLIRNESRQLIHIAKFYIKPKLDLPIKMIDFDVYEVHTKITLIDETDDRLQNLTSSDIEVQLLFKSSCMNLKSLLHILIKRKIRTGNYRDRLLHLLHVWKENIININRGLRLKQ